MKEQTPTICLVANFKYLYKNFPRIFYEIRTKGCFKGEILIITNFISPTFFIKQIKKKNNVSILRFKKIKFEKAARKSFKELNVKPNRYLTKQFQWNKLYLFHPKIKNWKYIFYLDINMTIHSDISSLLSIYPNNELLAREDGYPDFNWSLASQFDNTHIKYNDLKNNFNLDVKNYFQTGLMYFDTSIISSKTLEDILSLVNQYPLSITNEQGILNLYFLFIKNQYKSLVERVGGKLTYYYWMVDNEEVMITKAKRTKFK